MRNPPAPSTGAVYSDSDTLAHSRREHPRKLVQCRAKLLVAGLDQQIVHVFNMGQGGLGVIASARFAVGTACVVRLAIPNLPNARTSHELHDKVVYCAPTHNEGRFRLGLQFVRLNPLAARVIQRFVQD